MAASRSILLITPVEPKPQGIGIERRCWNHLEALRELGSVDVIVTPRPALIERGTHMQLWKDLCKVGLILPLKQDVPLYTSGRLGTALLGQFFNTNLRNHRLESSLKANKFSSLHGKHYTHVFCFRSRSKLMWEQLRKAWRLKADRVIVDFDDIESLAIRRALPFRAQHMGRELVWAERLRAWHLDQLERSILHSVDDVILCSKVDVNKLTKMPGRRAKLHVVPNTTAMNIATLPMPNVTLPFTMVFVGTMNYPPNQDAAKVFAHDILPILRTKAQRDFRCYLVGFKPPEDVKALDAIPEVTVTGGVDSVADYYARANVALAPIRFGGGTRIKILEAMAYGRPVVSTSLGAEGIEVTHEEDIFIADTPEAFADRLLTLMNNTKLQSQLASRGRKLVESRYSLNAAKAAIAAIV